MIFKIYIFFRLHYLANILFKLAIKYINQVKFYFKTLVSLTKLLFSIIFVNYLTEFLIFLSLTLLYAKLPKKDWL